MPDPIAAILLAAGGGFRMGRTKQLLRIGGQSMVRRAAGAVLDADCRPVIVVTGAESAAVSAEIAELPIQTAFNSDWSRGIGSSIRAGLSAARAADSKLAAIVLTLCDQPHLTAAVLRDLIALFTAAGKPMVACQYTGTLGPPCCFGRSMFDSLSHLGDADGAKRLLLADPSQVAVFPWPKGAQDLDTPADWERFCQNDSSSSESLS